MTIQEIKNLQAENGFSEIQDLIDNGQIWKFEGSVGRNAMDLLRNGACFLPEVRTRDYYGNLIPSRMDVKAGTCGSLENSINFYSLKPILK